MPQKSKIKNPLSKLQKNVEKLNSKALIGIISDCFHVPEIQDYIIETNQEQLFDNGQDSEGKKLMTDIGRSSSKYKGKYGYSKTTETIKRSEGKKYTNVTLKDSGKFFNSMKLNVKKQVVEIMANFRKGSENIFDNFQDSYTDFNDFKRSVLGLNEKNYNVLIDMLIPHVTRRIYNRIMQDV